MNKILKSIVLLLLLLAVNVLPVYAQSGEGPGKVIFGDNFTLKAGDHLEGDLVVFGGNVIIEEDSDLKGNLVVMGGTVSSDGNIHGDVVVFGGQIKLADKATVTGDVVTIGGQLDKDPGAVIHGQIVHNAPASSTRGLDWFNFRNLAVNTGFNPFWEFGRVMSASLFVAVLGMLASLFFQARLDRVSQAATTQPLMAGSMGLLTIVVMALLAVTIIFLPFVLLGLIPLAFAWLFGVIALGQEVGDRLAKAMRQDWTPVLATGIGTFVLAFLVTFVNAMNNLLPFVGCVTWIIPVLLGLLAIGAVVTTRFGARPVQVNAATVYSPPPAPPAGGL